jgi:AraC-like DNA-binding protein
MYIFDREELALGRDEIAPLQSWNVGQRVPAPVFARMVSHPQFGKAARAIAANMLLAREDDKALDGIFKDAGRYVAAMWAMYLHASGGLTLPRLKQMSTQSGYLSPGRARAMLLYMRHLGYVAPVSGRKRAEPVRYVPTETFTHAWRKHLRAAFEAAQIVEPGVAAVLDRLDEPAIMDSLSRARSEDLLASARDSDQNNPFLRVFMHRHAGMQIVWTLLLADKTFPPRNPLPISIAALARRFEVSRIHLRRMFDDAVRERLLTFDADGAATLTAPMRAMLEFLYAIQLIRLLGATAQTLAEIESAPPIPLAAAGK